MLVARVLSDPKAYQSIRFKCFDLLIDFRDEKMIFPRVSDNEARHDVLRAYFKCEVLVVSLIFIKNLCEIIQKNSLKRWIQSLGSKDVR